MSVKLIQVIETDLELRGDGKNFPFRRIRQYWQPNGELLAEKDDFLNEDIIKILEEDRGIKLATIEAVAFLLGMDYQIKLRKKKAL